MFERLAPEQFDSLPEIPEPSETTVLYGHSEITQQLAQAYRKGRLHHGLLLHGPRGIGKATFAFRLANHLLQYPEPIRAPESISDPETNSQIFRQIAGGAHPGVLHLTRPLDMDKKKFKTAITVDEIRRITRFLAMTAHDGGYRIVIVDPADDMNANAANALLKNLEEPPKRSLFILISHLPGRLLPTIRSRCQSVRFRPLEAPELLGVLQHLGETLPQEKLQREELLTISDGSPRNAILMTRYGGMELGAVIDDLLTGNSFDMEKAYKLAEVVSTRGSEVQFSVVNDMLLERITRNARKAGLSGDAENSARLSTLWLETRQLIGQTDTYNLDRKQHVIGTLMHLRKVLTECSTQDGNRRSNALSPPDIHK